VESSAGDQVKVSTTPLFSVVLTHVVTHEEHLTPARVPGMLLGLAGVVMLIGPEALKGLGRHGLAQLWTAFVGMALSLVGLITIDGWLLFSGARLVAGRPRAARSVPH
jgi:drug/metabolite transporter (DMT)-like permease